MERGEIIWIEVNGAKRSLRSWALENEKCPFTILRRYRMGITDPYELLKTRPRKPEVRPRAGQEVVPERTPEDLTETEKADLLGIAYASEGQKDHWKIMCDLAGIDRKYAKRLREVLHDD